MITSSAPLVSLWCLYIELCNATPYEGRESGQNPHRRSCVPGVPPDHAPVTA